MHGGYPVAASRGRGIALGFDPIVWDAPAAATLVRALPHRAATGSSYYLVYRKADLARPKLRACIDWLLAEMGAYKHDLWRRAESRSANPCAPTASGAAAR